ncbi:MAG: STAS domain-containing protein [Opitutaceae bacterium]|nr:STAS domain-containing protein [Opitutaceae bacterium]
MNTPPPTQSSSVITYVFRGDLLSTNAAAAQAELSRLMGADDRWKTIVLDLRAARIVDSVGLNLIVSIIRGARPAGRSVRVVVSNQNVRRVLAFTRIDQHAEVVVEEDR